MIVRSFFEELRLVPMPVLERVDGRSAFQDGLRELAVVEADVAQDRLFQILSGAEAVALQDVLDPAVESLDHAIRLRPHRRGQAVFDAKISAEAVELVRASGRAAAETEQPVGELLSIVGEHAGDRHRCSTLELERQIRQAREAYYVW